MNWPNFRGPVVLAATGADDATMLATAADVGFSETAFVVPRPAGSLDIRYFSPAHEVPFCGHATIATAVAYAQRPYAQRHGVGTLQLHTMAGPVAVSTSAAEHGSFVATVVSVPPKIAEISRPDLEELLVATRWEPNDLDLPLPPWVAYAGAWHPTIAASSRQRLADLNYDMAALADLMERNAWTTIDLIWRESADVFHSRNPFPPVVEDPATGAAAAAFGGYLRELGLIKSPSTITIHQGHDMGRPWHNHRDDPDRVRQRHLSHGNSGFTGPALGQPPPR